MDIANGQGQKQRLRLLETQANNLRGHLPVNFPNLNNLTTVDSSNIQLIDPIPK